MIADTDNIKIPDILTDTHPDVKCCLALLFGEPEPRNSEYRSSEPSAPDPTLSSNQEHCLHTAKSLLVRCYSALLEYDDLMPVELSMFNKPSPYLLRFITANQKSDNNQMISALQQLLPELARQQEHQRTGEAILLALELKSMGNTLGLLQQNPKNLLATPDN